ncbi:oxygen-dependent protoporphyrinogen oxidase [Botryosphaeria dothidea]
MPAFYASRRFPDASITLFERTQRLGGIMGSIQARVGNTSIISDTGPRTIRANAPRAIVTLDLVTPPPLSCAAPPPQD